MFVFLARQVQDMNLLRHVASTDLLCTGPALVVLTYVFNL